MLQHNVCEAADPRECIVLLFSCACIYSRVCVGVVDVYMHVYFIGI